MKKLVIIATGGTIASRAGREGLVPALPGAELAAQVPELAEYASCTVEEFANLPSGQMTPQLMLALARQCDAAFARGADGVVVTHGTDTLEETAYFLDMAVASSKPVCVTGAMRAADAPGADGPANLLAAVRVAASRAAGGRGALVVFNDEIHAAASVTKLDTVACDTFQSPRWGALGRVYEQHVYFARARERSERLPAAGLVEPVPLLKVYTGMDDCFFKAAATAGARALVVEALGCGNVPPAVKRGLSYLRERNIPVVLASRATSGPVLPSYAYPGGGAELLGELGLVAAGELNGLKARLRLMLLLALPEVKEDPALLARYF